MLYAIVALLVIILDQWLKYWVAGNIALNSGIKELIPGVLSLVNIHNEGAAFGFLSGGNARIYFIIICGVFTVAVIVALATNFISGSLGRWSAIFIMAGGIGNCIDRILYGFVQDMFKVEFFNFPIFNVADIFITVFCFVFILHILFGGEKGSARRRRLDDDYDDDDEDEEEAPPVRRRRGEDAEERPVRRRGEDAEERPVRRRRDAFDDDDDEEEDAPVRPVFRRRESEEAPVQKQPARKSRQPKYEQEYEQFKAARAARQQQAPAVPVQNAPVVDPSDPFAEWERANSRVEAQKTAAPAAAPVQAPVQPPVRPIVQEQIPVQPRQPAAPVQPAPIPAPAPAPAKKPSDGLDFDLEDILSEFK